MAAAAAPPPPPPPAARASARPSGVARPNFGVATEPAGLLPVAVPRLRTARGRRGRRPRYATQEEHLRYSELVEEAEVMCATHYEPSSAKVAESARRCLEAFLDRYEDERPDMFWGPGEQGLSWRASLHNEISLMLWAAWMVSVGLAASTTETYLSLARTTLEMEIGWKLTIPGMQVRLPKMMRRLRKMHKTVRRKRLGWRAAHHRAWRAVVGAVDSEPVALADAVLCTAREGLARIAELCPAQAAHFDASRLPTIEDVTFHATPEPHLILWLLPAKKPPGQVHKMPVPLPEASGEEAGAFAAIVRMLQMRQRAAGWRGPVFDDDGAVNFLPRAAPLFAHFASGAAVTKVEAVDMFQAAAVAIGLEGTVGGHSGRIGGATDHFAMETPPPVLQICGRWDSDLWQIYTRQCIEQTLRYTARASGCADAAVEEIFDDYTQPAVVASGI